MATRRILGIVLALIFFFAVPISSLAQHSSGNIRRIGVLLFNSPQADPIGPFLENLRSLGYVDGKNIALDYAFAEGTAERLPELAAALVEHKPDVIFAYGGDVAPHAKAATKSIPIVAMVSNDPVQSGLVASLSKPGGNVTGLTLIYDDLAGKMLDLLKEAVPEITRIAVLWNPNHADPEFRETKRVAITKSIDLQSLEVRTASDFDEAFSAATDQHAEGLIVVSTRLLLNQRQKILTFATNSKVPTIGNWGDWARDGLLLSYGPNTEEAMKRVAVYVDRILKGARPADLPIERPTRFELVINLKTAKTIGLTIPPTLLARADAIIE
jgi:putative tryptophan/tyrosine transport system substrate-binding protein